MTRSRSSLLLLWSLAFANCAAVILVCLRWVDRPVADRVQAMMRQTPLFDWTARVLGWLHVVLVIAVLLLLWWSVQALRRRPLPAWMATPLLCSSATIGALLAALWLKILIGRSQVYPGWIERREYGFTPLHGFQGHGAFPSATMSVALAIAAVLWIRIPRHRALYVVATAVVATAVVMTNGHWVSDVIGGAFLGAFIGWATVARIATPVLAPADHA